MLVTICILLAIIAVLLVALVWALERRGDAIYVRPATPTIAELPRMDVATKWRKERWQ